MNEVMRPGDRLRRWGTQVMCAAALAGGTGCPTKSAGETAAESSEETPSPDTAELRAQAHAQALKRLLPLAQTVAALDDPITASTLTGAPPRVPPVTAGDREALRAALDVALQEAEGLDASVLPAEQRVVAMVTRFMLDRARDGLSRRRPFQDDPTWITAQIGDLLDVLELDARDDGACASCAQALALSATSIDAARDGLAASSIPAATAARDDARTLASRIRALPDPAEPHEQAANALLKYADHLNAVINALPDAQAIDPGAPLAKAATAADVRRRPARLGLEAMRRRLEVRENISESPSKLVTRMGRTIPMLAAMLRKRTVLVEDSSSTTVTLARCEATWAGLKHLAVKHAPEVVDTFRCEAFVRGLGSQTLTDAALRVAVIDTALVGTMRRDAQAKLPAALAMVGGRFARTTQAHSLRSALVLTPPEDRPSAAMVLWSELDAACLATAALWVHAELGEDDALDERLSKHCPRPTAVLIDEALARPGQTLRAVGLARVGMGPAGVVPLDLYWWMPLGLIDIVADPSTTTPRPPVPLEINVEELQPKTQTPPADDPTKGVP